MKKVALLFCIVFFISACSFNSSTESSALKVIELSEERFQLVLPKEHPKGFSIKDPNGKWFVLQDKEAEIFLSGLDFEKATNVLVNTRSLKGVVWEGGTRIEKNVFSIEGEYLLYLADNLETEMENTFSMSVIYNLRR